MVSSRRSRNERARKRLTGIQSKEHDDGLAEEEDERPSEVGLDGRYTSAVDVDVIERFVGLARGSAESHGATTKDNGSLQEDTSARARRVGGAKRPT